MQGQCILLGAWTSKQPRQGSKGISTQQTRPAKLYGSWAVETTDWYCCNSGARLGRYSSTNDSLAVQVYSGTIIQGDANAVGHVICATAGSVSILMLPWHAAFCRLGGTLHWRSALCQARKHGLTDPSPARHGSCSDLGLRLLQLSSASPAPLLLPAVLPAGCTISKVKYFKFTLIGQV